MKKFALSLVALSLMALGLAQPFRWPAEYAATIQQGGELRYALFGDMLTLNPVLTSSAQEVNLIGYFGGPGLVYRDWLGNRSFKNEDGEWNKFWASEIIEEVPNRQFLVTVRQGWMWSDGVEMTVDDIIAAYTIIGDPEVGSNAFSCAYVEDDPVTWERIDDYTIRIFLPGDWVNTLAAKNCGTLPAHIFMPVYEAEGAAGIRAMWGVDTPVDQLISGGPYRLVEFRQGEQMVFERNPMYGEFVQAADGSPVPGPDRIVVTFAADQSAIQALVVTGQSNFWYPNTLDQVRAVQDALQTGAIQGTLYANLGPDKLVDYVTFNFNNTDPCKANMFRETAFRQAFSKIVDRQAIIDVALGGLGFPGHDYSSAAAAPFFPDHLPPLEFDPEEATVLLNSIGFTQLGPDGVLFNPETGCRVAFDLTYNSGNIRRAQIAQVISQTAAEFGWDINPREVDSGTWSGSITGTSLPRAVDYDANIWGLAGGDVDNPAGINVLALGVNLNAWNKSTTDVQAWEILLDRLTKDMSQELDRERRIEIYMRRAELMRQQMPMIPIISPAFHFYFNMENVWPREAMDANSIDAPNYRPGNYTELLQAPR